MKKRNTLVNLLIFVLTLPLMFIFPGMGGFSLPNLGNLGLGKGNGEGTQSPYKSHVGITHGDAAYDTMAEVLAIIGALAAGSVWTKVWEMTVEAQSSYRWGFGSPATPHNQGYMWFASLDSGTGFQTGILRLTQATHRENIIKTVLEVDDTRLHTATSTNLGTATPTNINEMIALPEKIDFPKVGRDSLLQVWYRAITVPAAEDDVGFSIPVTIRQ